MNDQNSTMDPAEVAMGKISGGLVLDVATGSGGFVGYLIENLKDFTEIIGIDCNQRALDAASKAHPQDNIHFLHMDAEMMEFPDSHFDTVCMANSLHHMANLPKVLVEMRRVCKAGGQIIISEMYRDDQSETQLSHVYLHHWWAAVDTAEGITHYETFTRNQVTAIIERLGLQRLSYFDLRDLESDPKDPELIRELDGIIDRYFQRAQNVGEARLLHQRGEELRQRVHEVGFHGATTLLAIGEK
jgi:SAM-dependent methyltransferase